MTTATHTLHFYDGTGTRILRTTTYRTRQLANAALRRAAKQRQIACFAGVRTGRDHPTCHH